MCLKECFPDKEVIMANHNSFINENFYNIYPSSKKYDMVVSSSFTDFKRVILGRKIKNTAHIGYSCMGHLDYIPDYGFRANFKNNSRDMKDYHYLNQQEILDIYSSSKIGGIFSKTEGACFSSGEYLLCGLPVLSTHCKGGREYFYDNYNCVLCEPTEDAIYKGFKKIMKRYKKNDIDPIKIRNNHIKIMEEQRDILTNKVIEIYKKICLNPPDFKELRNKLKYYHSNINVGTYKNIDKNKHPIFYEECFKQSEIMSKAIDILKN